MTDEAAPDAEDTVPAAEPASDPARPRRTVPAGAFVVALMVAAALAVLAVIALASGDGDASTSGERDVRLAAGRFAERFLTFEHDALDEWKHDVLALSTRGFAEEVEDVESSLRTLIGESRLDATTQVTDTFVGEEERGAVGVVVVYDRTVDGEEVDRTETDRYLELSLVRIDGQWLVDNVIDIASSEALDGAIGPGATTTSTP